MANYEHIPWERYAHRIPETLLGELRAYVEDGRPVSYSTHRMLVNDFLGTVAACDEETFAALRSICGLIYWELPSLCHGSPERVAAWTAAGARQRREREEEQEA